ncbi:hypothetical protein ACHAW6_007048 [Cyclotella cf. meneghiniana]
MNNPSNPRTAIDPPSWSARACRQDKRRMHKFLRVAVVSTIVFFMLLDQKRTLHVSILLSPLSPSSSQQRSLSKSSSTINQSKKESVYLLALSRFWSRVNSTAAAADNDSTNHRYYTDLQSQHQALHNNDNENDNNKNLPPKTKLINSIRIPKAASSSLSVTARALAGCHPDGYPCCGYPGDPPGSCPKPGLFCPQVTGCTDHRPDFRGNEPVITSLRDPVSRAVSAYFYTPPHTTVAMGEAHTWELFVENVRSGRRRNVLTKMMNGAYAYDEFDEVGHTVVNATKRLCRAAWFGMSDMPVASALLLYETKEFRRLLPNPVVFGLPPPKEARNESITENEEGNSGLRVNNDEEYKEFLTNDFVKNNGTALVMEYNRQDGEVYRLAEKLFCVRLFLIPGLVEDMKRVGLAVEEIEECTNIVGGGVSGDMELLCPG